MGVTGGLFTAAGLALLLPLGRWRPWLPRAVMGVLALPYALLAWGLGRGQFWLGMSVYVILTLGCVAEAAAWRPRAPRTVGWKLLRGLAFAGLVPLLALGGVASFLAQRAIEEQVREDTVRTALGEADFVRRYLEDARESLPTAAGLPGFRAALARGRPAQARALPAQPLHAPGAPSSARHRRGQRMARCWPPPRAREGARARCRRFSEA